VARILSDALQVLRRIYRVPGQLKAPQDLEVELPVQFVHDVSRESELGVGGLVGKNNGLVAGELPFFTIALDQVHAAAGVLENGIGVYSNQSTTWALATWNVPNPATENVWILYAFAQTTVVASVDELMMYTSVIPKAGAGSGADPTYLFWTGHGTTLNPDIQNAFAVLSRGAGAGGPFGTVIQPPAPILISNKLLNNSALQLISEANIACTVDHYIRCMRLPIGVYPPGMS